MKMKFNPTLPKIKLRKKVYDNESHLQNSYDEIIRKFRDKGFHLTYNFNLKLL